MSGATLMTLANLSKKQGHAIDFLFEHNYGLIIAPTGAGKTVIGLTALTELLDGGHIHRALVVAPAKVVSNWQRETRKWAHLDEGDIAAGTGRQRVSEIVKSPARILVTSYDSLPVLLEMDHGCDAFLLDEITRMKATGGEVYKKLYSKIKLFRWRFGLSATPLSENWQNIFGQVKLLDLGERIGRNKQKFMDLYFNKMDFNGYRWEPRFDTPEKLTALLSSMVHIIPESDKRETQSAPVMTEVAIPAPDIIKELQEEIRQEFLVSIGTDTITAANSAVVSGKLRQLAQGFLYHDDGSYTLLWSGRIDALAELIHTTHEPVVVTYEFSAVLEELLKRFPEADVISGGLGKSMFNRVMETWRSGKGKLLFLQVKAGSHGLDGLQYSARKLINFAPIWSNDAAQQLVGRLDRTGQTRQVEVVNLIVRGTIDRSVLRRVKDKGSVFQDFLSHIEK